MKGIESFQTLFSRSGEPVVLTVPAYQVAESMLLLDSTHRVVAAYSSHHEMRLLVAAIQGPADPAILPDLGRRQGKVLSAGRV